MQIQTIQYVENKGWSVDTFPKMDSENTLIIVFAAPEFIRNAAPIKELSQHYPKSIMVGCSSSGEIFESFIYDKSLTVAILHFDKTQLKAIKKEIKNPEDSYACGKYLADELKGKGLAGIFVLSEGLNVNGSELVKGLNTIDDKKVVITGGLAGDGSNFKQTWTVLNGEIHLNTIIAVGLYGDSIEIAHASRGGWDIFGPERHITRSKNNILYELDGRPALELYKEYLGDKAKGLPATGLLYPLAIRTNKDDSKQLVRTILATNEKDQSLTFAGDVPLGNLAQLMRANFDRLIASAGEAGESSIKKIITKSNKDALPVACISISCVGRRLLLGERTEEEVETVRETLPAKAHQIGFYSYGELSPYSTGQCDLHNQTLTLTLFYEN
ncbi:MAG: FIST N-terminal domain-containing protein [Alphaproteobacteria bacterium]|nr:FIST N-terminal domain-containing protein [Alphaproteobacteria bacterium]